MVNNFWAATELCSHDNTLDVIIWQQPIWIQILNSAAAWSVFNFVVVAAVFKRRTARWQCVNLVQPREWQCRYKNADLCGQEFISLLKVFRSNLISVSIFCQLPTHSSIIQANKHLMFWFSALREPSVHNLYFLRYDTMSVRSSETISVICLSWYIAAAILWINTMCSGMQYLNLQWILFKPLNTLLFGR